MYQSHYEFLVKVLGRDGANALRKAQSRSSYLGAALLPRAIFSWITNTVSNQYEGEIPGISNTYLVLSKSETGYSGKIKVDDFIWNFNDSSIFQVAAGIALALDVDPPELQIKDMDLTKLGKSVDLLVKHHNVSLELEKLEKKVLDPSLGYQFSHEHHDLGGGKTLTKVNVHAPDGSHVAAATFSHQGDSLVPGSVVVDEGHQRKGIASAMYAHAQKLTGKNVVPSPNQTPEGAALWSGNKQSKQFGKVERPMKGKPGLPMTEEPIGQMGPSKGVGQMGPKSAGQPKPIIKPLKVAKSELKNKTCLNCGTLLCKQTGEFSQITGCLCIRELMKNVKISSTSDLFEFDIKKLDTEEVETFLDVFGICR